MPGPHISKGRRCSFRKKSESRAVWVGPFAFALAFEAAEEPSEASPGVLTRARVWARTRRALALALATKQPCKTRQGILAILAVLAEQAGKASQGIRLVLVATVATLASQLAQKSSNAGQWILRATCATSSGIHARTIGGFAHTIGRCGKTLLEEACQRVLADVLKEAGDATHLAALALAALALPFAFHAGEQASQANRHHARQDALEVVPCLRAKDLALAGIARATKVEVRAAHALEPRALQRRGLAAVTDGLVRESAWGS